MNPKNRKLILQKLREARSYWLKKASEQQNINNGSVMPDNVVPFPNQENGGVERVKVKTLGTHPGAGNFSYNQDERAGFASGLILAGITFVTELLFLAISYFLFK